MHARPIGVEDARHLDVQPVLAVVIEKQRLRAAFPFVVAGSRSNRVDIPPIVFRLGMNGRIAIDLGRGSLENSAFQPFGKAQHVDGAVHAGLGGLHRIALIVDRRGRAGQIVDLVDLDIERKGDVVAEQLEAIVTEDAIEIAPRAGEEIVDADDARAVGQ